MAGIYIHIPFCKSKCRYCDFTSYPGKIGLADAYMACVYKEMKLRAQELKNKTFDSPAMRCAPCFWAGEPRPLLTRFPLRGV